jgi:5-methylcytosine-specific restriction endonuclease McrA
MRSCCPLNALKALGATEVYTLLNGLAERIKIYSRAILDGWWDSLEEFDIAMGNREAVRQSQIARVVKVLEMRREIQRDYARLFLTLVRRDGSACRRCGDPSPDLEIDHINPLSLEGDNEEDNLQLLCKPCNIRKSNNPAATQASHEGDRENAYSLTR